MTQTTIDHGDTLELVQEQPLPKIFQAKNNELNLTTWTRENRDYLEETILKNGAILFRGFAMHQPEDLEELVSSLTPEMLNYVEGSSPRTRLTDKVYTSTEYPPEFEISMHNELSYAHKWPSRLFFFCMTAPQVGGETPLVDSRKIYQTLDKTILETFITRGVKYIRNLHGGRGVGLSWQTVFETNDKAQVEQYCKEGDIEYQWTKKGGLRTSQLRPAAIKHPITHEPLWFNQVDQWHPTNLPEATRNSMLALMSEKDFSIYATYGDGSLLEADVLDHIRNTTRQATIKFPWQNGDVLLIDNTLVAHGRSTFNGPRKIVLAMGGTVGLNGVEVIKAL